MNNDVKRLVESYFELLSLEASESKEEFDEYLHQRHPAIAKKWEMAITVEKREEEDRVEIYKIKNQSLQFGLDVARMIADFYKQYCIWFASLNWPQPKRVLDVGCDNGILTCFYAYLFPRTEVIGVDISEEGIRCANELANKLGLSNVMFEKMDFSEIDDGFPNEHFDIVTSVRCLHEIMGAIPVPVYWSLDEYLERFPVNSDPRYIEIIEHIMTQDGLYISSERIENPASVGQWSNLLELAGLHLDWETTGFIQFHEWGTKYKMPVIAASKSDSGMNTMEGIRELYTKDIEFKIDKNSSFRSVGAELVFNQFADKKLLTGRLLIFGKNWYKMRFEIWETEKYLLVYACGNMGYRQLKLVSLDEMEKAEEHREVFLNQYVEHGQVLTYSSIKELEELV